MVLAASHFARTLPARERGKPMAPSGRQAAAGLQIGEEAVNLSVAIQTR